MTFIISLWILVAYRYEKFQILDIHEDACFYKHFSSLWQHNGMKCSGWLVGEILQCFLHL